MDSLSPELLAVLGCLSQPAFAVRSLTTVFSNPAAREAGITDGLSVYALLPAGSERYLAFDGAGTLSVTVRTAAGDARATVLRMEQTDLFLLESIAEAGAAARLAAFSDLAQSLRLPVANLFATASNLFPQLEQYEDPTVQKQVSVLNRCFYQLLRTVGNLTEAGRLLDEDAPLRAQPTELHGWFCDLSGRIAPLCEAAGIAFSAEAPSGQLLAHVDPTRLERAVLNLLSNALRHTPSGGRIAMRLEDGRTSALIRITDSGDGMTASALSGAFTRFRAAQNTDPRCGIGLGLPIARRIAAEHGGTVMLHSQPGAGTTAVLSFSLGSAAGASLRTPTVALSGFDPVLVELSDALPSEVFDSENVN